MKRARLLVVFVVVGLTIGAGYWLTTGNPGTSSWRHGQALTGHSVTTSPADVLKERSAGAIQDDDSLRGSLVRRPAHDGWVRVSGDASPVAGIDVSEPTPGVLFLEFVLPGFNIESVVVGGRQCSRLTLPGQVRVREVGLPEVPMLATSLIIPANGEPRLEITEHVVREMKIDPVEPSLGHLTRNIDPAQVTPVFDAFYKQGEIWPADAVVLGRPFIMRKLRGANVRVHPLRYDAARGVLEITERLVITVRTGAADDANAGYSATGSPVTPNPPATAFGAEKAAPGFGPDSGGAFDTVNRTLFGNYAASRRAGEAKYERLADRGRMLIVSDPSYVDVLAPFMEWKQQLGISVAMVTTEQTGATAKSIKQVIRSYYDEPAGLVWVVLVGDRPQIPTNSGTFDGSDSDNLYAMLAGDDNYPDVFISRISANSAAEVQTQVAKFIAYEKYPATGGEAAWYGQATCIASDEGSPPDFERAEVVRADLLAYSFTVVDDIYEGQGGSGGAILAALAEGRSLVTYLGHGSGTGWLSVPFGTNDVHGLDNTDQLPWIIDVSCYNGDLALTECFAEAWLRAGTANEPRGAVAIMSASSLAPWVPPTVMQTEIIDLLTGEQANTIGSLYFCGLMKVLDQYAGLGVCDQVVEQNIIFGDCSLMIRTAAPRAFQVESAASLAVGAGSLLVDVTGPAGAVVALTGDGTRYGTGIVGADGVAEVFIDETLTDGASLQLTVSGYNMVPHFSTVTVGDGTGGDDDAGSDDEGAVDDPLALPQRVQLLGNYPNPFNPDTRIVFELPRDLRVQLTVYDVRGHLVKVLVDEQRTVGRYEEAWHGLDAAGRRVASGVYLYTLTTEDGVQSGRMVLSK